MCLLPYREQRITGFVIHVLIGISTLITVVLQVWRLNYTSVSEAYVDPLVVIIRTYIFNGRVISFFYQYIPMAVLYGVFLYMGVTSLSGVQVGQAF